MRLIRAILEISAVVRAMAGLPGAFEKVFQQMNSAVQVIGVARAHLDVQFAHEFRTQRFPVALHDVAQIVVLSPVFGYFAVDDARLLVEYRLWIAIAADGAVHGLPDIELFGRASVTAERSFEARIIAQG